MVNAKLLGAAAAALLLTAPAMAGVNHGAPAPHGHASVGVPAFGRSPQPHGHARVGPPVFANAPHGQPFARDDHNRFAFDRFARRRDGRFGYAFDGYPAYAPAYDEDQGPPQAAQAPAAELVALNPPYGGADRVCPVFTHWSTKLGHAVRTSLCD
jgi:hypothetical protein